MLVGKVYERSLVYYHKTKEPTIPTTETNDTGTN